MTTTILQMAALVLSGPTGVLLFWLQHRQQPPRRWPLAELRLRARAELNQNPTITVYEWVDGREVRKAAEPWAKFRRGMRQLGQAHVRLEISIRGFAEGVQRALAAMPEPSVRLSEQTPRPRPLHLVSVDPGLSRDRHAEFVREFDAALDRFESRMDCPHDSSSGGLGPDRTWRCDECGEITGREER